MAKKILRENINNFSITVFLMLAKEVENQKQTLLPLHGFAFFSSEVLKEKNR